MTQPHASNPTGHPPRPTLEQIEAAASAPVAPRPPAAVTRDPDPTVIDWRATVEAIAARSRPHRQQQAAARARRETILAEQRADRARAANRTRAAEQVPARYRQATADHPEVRRWADDVIAGRTRDGLVLNGPTGCGKTWQAYGAWSAVAQHTGRRSIALPVPAYLDSLRPGRQPLAALDAVETAELLLLDDLAGERSSEWTIEVVYRLIDARWNACLPTIVTLNAPVQTLPDGSRISSLREQLGDRIASRLNGLGRVVSWPADAPDRRRPPTD